VFARGGSKGLPGKNIRPLAGKPLIAYAIETGRASPSVGRVLVSTDDPSIAEAARTYGAEVPFIRPHELARDDSPELLAWKHALHFLKAERDAVFPEVFVSLPAIAPLRAVDDVEACIEKLCSDPDADIVITVRRRERSPYFSTVAMDNNCEVHRLLGATQPLYRRQDAPAAYEVVPLVYAARPAFIMALDSPNYFLGRVRGVLVPEERAIDIDTEMDFLFAEFLLRQRAACG